MLKFILSYRSAACSRKIRRCWLLSLVVLLQTGRILAQSDEGSDLHGKFEAYTSYTLREKLFVHTDKLFNELCLSTCGNEFVVDTMRLMQGPSRRFWFQRSRDAEILVESATLHAALAAAIAEGDPDVAAHASDRLLDSAERFARRAIEEAGDALAVR